MLIATSPLIFLHDADVVPGRVGALEDLHNVVDVDVPRHPGFGTDDELAVSWDSVGDLALYHIERIKRRPTTEKVHLMGAGFGGWVALEIAVRARALLASLILVAPYGVKVLGRMEPEFADILLLDPEELIALGWADGAKCASVRMPGYPADLDNAADERAYADRAALARYGWKPFMYDPRLARWLSVIDIPVLVISGGADRMVAPHHSELVAARIPGAKFVTIKGAGHYPYIESPADFTETVTSFLTNLPCV